MLRALNRFLSARSRAWLVIGSFVLVAAIGTLDHLTGYELSFSIFYLIPVGIGSWYAGRRVGILVCLVSATTWLVVDHTAGHPYSHSAIPFWNAGVRFGFFVVMAHLLARLRLALELHASLAQQDGLTGMMNARTFKRRSDSLAQLAVRHGQPTALGYLDLDGFKGVNDSLGLSGGDQVLKAVGHALSRRLRGSDLVARLGGDEFAILLPETDLAGARAFFTEMRDRLLRLAADNGWPVGFSIGVAVFRPPPSDFEEAVRRADELMYKAKRIGKNEILFEDYSDGPPSLAAEDVE